MEKEDMDKFVDAFADKLRKVENLEEFSELKDAFGDVKHISPVKSDVLCDLCPIVTMAFNNVFSCPYFRVFMDYYTTDGDGDHVRLAVKYDNDIIVSADYLHNCYLQLRDIKVHVNSPYTEKAVTRLVAVDFVAILKRCANICSAVWNAEADRAYPAPL